MPQANPRFLVPFNPTLDINRPVTHRGRPATQDALMRKTREALTRTSRDGLAHCDGCRRAIRTGEFVAITTGMGRKFERLCARCYDSGKARGPTMGVALLSPDITLPDKSQQH